MLTSKLGAAVSISWLQAVTAAFACAGVTTTCDASDRVCPALGANPASNVTDTAAAMSARTAGTRDWAVVTSVQLVRVQLGVVGADVDPAPGHRWRRRHLVASGGAEQGGAGRGAARAICATGRIKGIELVVERAHVDDPVGDRRRRKHHAAGGGSPQGGAGRGAARAICATGGIKGVQLGIVRPYVNPALGYCWRSEEEAAGVEGGGGK